VGGVEKKKEGLVKLAYRVRVALSRIYLDKIIIKKESCMAVHQMAD